MNARKEIQKQIRDIKREMKARGIKRTSCFNGGMSNESYRYNSRCFALETKLADLKA